MDKHETAVDLLIGQLVEEVLEGLSEFDRLRLAALARPDLFPFGLVEPAAEELGIILTDDIEEDAHREAIARCKASANRCDLLEAEGAQAYCEGIRVEENPYQDPLDRLLWDGGWIDAEQRSLERHKSTREVTMHFKVTLEVHCELPGTSL